MPHLWQLHRFATRIFFFLTRKGSAQNKFPEMTPEFIFIIAIFLQAYEEWQTDLNSVSRGCAMACLRPRIRSCLDMLAAAPLGGVKSKNIIHHAYSIIILRY